VPNSPEKWFKPSVNPQIDLQAGALAVMGGVNNTTNKQLLAMQNASSGGLLDVGSGVQYSIPNKVAYLTNGNGDINYTAFP
jgi:hypothetical protein